MTFDAPIVVALSPVVAVAVWFAAAWARRTRIRRAAAWSEQTARTARAAGRLGSGTLGLAAGLAAVALAGPRWGEEKIVTETRGLNLVIAVDISRSMLAEDAAGRRSRRRSPRARTCCAPARRSPTGSWWCSAMARGTTRSRPRCVRRGS